MWLHACELSGGVNGRVMGPESPGHWQSLPTLQSPAELSPPPHLSAGGGRPKGLSCPARHQRPQAEGCLTPAFLVGVVEPHGPDSPGGEESQSEVSQGHTP